MGKKSRKKRERREAKENDRRISSAQLISWQDEEGLHFVSPGSAPSPEQVAAMTKEYQNQIRNSPLWHEMVNQFGLKKAEELLKECQVNITPGQKR
jgi:hypothetical protein